VSNNVEFVHQSPSFEMTIPPEILFDRFLRRSGKFQGKQDLIKLPGLQCELLSSIQESLNEALRNEKKDVPEHVDHPPFHFDYIASDALNAIAFKSENHSFIGIYDGFDLRALGHLYPAEQIGTI
jgi:hypothetical protein